MTAERVRAEPRANARWPLCQADMDAYAFRRAELGVSTDDIREELRRGFPGMPFENCYQNVASVAKMRYWRQGQRIVEDRAKLRSENKPERWAERQR